MRAIRRIFGKDSRRLRWAVLGWWAVLALRLYTAKQPPSLDRWQAMELGIVGGVLFYWPVLLILMYRLVEADSPAKEQGFSLTRPMVRRDLLLAKLGFVAALIWVPAACAQLLALHAYGFGGGALWAALAESLVPDLALTSLALVVAAVSPSFRWYVGVWIGSAAFYILSGAALWELREAPRVPEAASAETSRWLAAAGLALGLFLATATYQFLRRSRGRALALAALGILVVASVQVLGPAPLPAGPGPEGLAPDGSSTDGRLQIPLEVGWVGAGYGTMFRLEHVGTRSLGLGNNEVYVQLELRTVGSVGASSAGELQYLLEVGGRASPAPRYFERAGEGGSQVPAFSLVTSTPTTRIGSHNLTFHLPPEVALDEGWQDGARIHVARAPIAPRPTVP